MDHLARLCAWHHYQKTNLGYRLHGQPGTWTWHPPDAAHTNSGTPP
jgi:hypothetical protein